MYIFNIELQGSTRNKSLDTILKLQKRDIKIMVNLDQNGSVKYVPFSTVNNSNCLWIVCFANNFKRYNK